MKSPFRLLPILLLVALILTLRTQGVPIASAATNIVVTTTAPDASVDAVCSLREAITNFNDAANTYSECGFTSDLVTITFNIPSSDTGCSTPDYCVITLNGATLPNIARAATLTIDGSAQHITVRGGAFINAEVEIMRVNSGATLHLNALNLMEGRCTGCTGGGGAVYNAGTLLVTNSTFNSNHSIESAGNPSVGGALYNDGGSVTIANSTFISNSAQQASQPARGGAIFNSGTLNVTNSTFLANFVSSSIEAVGGILYNTGTATFRNTILAQNSQSSACFNSGTLAADSFNLATDGTCDAATQTTNAALDLQSLRDHGGPTSTVSLGTNSSAWETGNDAVCAAPVGSPTYGAGGADQRGITRPQGVQCDVGAVEELPRQTFVVNSSAGDVDGSCDPLVVGVTDCTLRDAIAAANNAKLSMDTITFAIPAGQDCTAVNVCTISLGGNVEEITDDVIVDGSAQTITIDGINTYHVFAVPTNTVVNVNDIKIVNAYDACCGAGLSNAGTTILTRVSIRDSASGGDGGAIFNPGTLQMLHVQLTGNTATGDGGGLQNKGAAVLLYSLLTGNRATNGGGMNNASARIYLVADSTISGNSAAVGGGMRVTLGLGYLLNLTIADNTASVKGGGLSSEGTGGIGFGNTIVAGNRVGSNITAATADCNNENQLGSLGYNLVGAGTGCPSNNTGDQTVAPATVFTTVLGSLADNGGNTLTHALLAGSPAIDNAAHDTDGSCAQIEGEGAPVDQRGVTRPQGAGCDIGAFEFQPSTAVNVTGFRGVSKRAKIVLKWQTGNESQLAGFNVYRRVGKGKWKQVNKALLQAKHAGSAQGDKYSFRDKKVKTGKTYRYKLQIVYLDSSMEWTPQVKIKKR